MVKMLFLTTVLTTQIMAAEKSYKQSEVSRHKSESDCWLTIDGAIYNVTDYLARHRDFDYDITRHCGSDASALWQSKPGTGDAHSRKAERLLKKYRIGTLKKP